jgi:hypothetical protein
LWATLIIVFPTPHEGGAFLIRYKDQEWRLDPGKELATSPRSSVTEVGYAAFYSDVEHEVMPVTSGHRITLTYNLYLEPIPSLASSPPLPLLAPGRPGNLNPEFIILKSTLQELLADSSFLPDGGRIGFGLSHQYPYIRSLAESIENAGILPDSDEDEDGESLRLPAFGRLHGVIGILKGIDLTLYKVCTEELGLRAQVRMLYEYWDGEVKVLLDRVIELADVYDEDTRIPDVLEVDYGGEAISATDESVMVDLDPGLAVEWVSEPRQGLNRVKTGFVTIPGDGSRDFIYGDPCVIVEVGNAADRKTL